MNTIRTIRHNFRVWRRLTVATIRAHGQYRLSLLMQAVGQFISTGIAMVAIVALFDRFGALQGWALAEIAIFYGVAQLSLGVGETWAAGFKTFGFLVRGGGFDRLLLRPAGTATQVAGTAVGLNPGRALQALLVLGWGAAALSHGWTPGGVMLLIATVIAGACLFAGVFILQATLAFWTTESLELANILTYGGAETAEFPLSIYADWFRHFFVFVVPVACVVYFPVLTILDHPDPANLAPLWIGWIAPLAGPLFLGVSLLAWRLGVRHYRSTGS